MAEKRNCFTFIWKIKNYSFNHGGQIISPSFFTEGMGETKWKLKLYSKSNTYVGSIACYVERENDSGPDNYELDCELSFLNDDDSALISQMFIGKVFTKNSNHWHTAIHAKRDEVFLLNKALFIPYDTLTIRFRMWDKHNSITQSGRCFAETLIETECRTILGIIKKFSSTLTSSKNLVCIKSPATETFLSVMNLCVTSDGKLAIEIKPVDVKTVKMFKCKIFIRDVLGGKVKSGEGEFFDTESYSIPLTGFKDQLMENKGIYLPNDVLTLDCDFIFATGNKIEKIEEPEYGFDSKDTQKRLSDVTKPHLYSVEDNIENLPILKDDLIKLLKEGSFCDTTLKTATEAFPAHTVILGARSPVFKSMFTTNMKENTSKCVNIDDLDADTVRRMLAFMYSDSLEELQYENAKSLYFAADKYNIILLKHRCSNFLKQNLSLSNCCDVLILAEKHQDRELKRSVQDYIAKNDEPVLTSDEWKNLEKINPQVALETFRLVYMGIRRNY